MKKLSFLLTFAVGIAIILIFQNAAPPPPPNPLPDVAPQVMTFEQTPPEVKHIWVRKLQTPLPGGENMLLELELDASSYYNLLSSSVDIYYGGTGQKITFFDNGTGGDVTAYDNIYSANVTENIQAFRSQIIANETELVNQGHYLSFAGHTGEDITSIPHFDVAAFDLFTRVELHPDITKPGLYTPCKDAIDKARSLLITDLSVVEDPARTYNIVTGVGNPVGAWTFGTMIKNIINTPVTSISTKAFLKSWLKNWTEDIVVNGQTIVSRDDIVPLFIRPWLVKAGSSMATTDADSEWEDFWDLINTDSLLKYAPFKLTAIVNRIDLRGNSAYASSINNSGETRFIFTLVNPTTGYTVIQENSNLSDPLDWSGFNIIFEYGNTQTTICSIKDHAQRWKELSDYALGTTTFNDHLQAITDYVTLANANLAKPNHSAINRVRTNERVFHRIGGSFNAAWEASDWEFRQFELDAGTHQLVQVPLTNTPNNEANAADAGNLVMDRGSISTIDQADKLIDWMFNPFTKSSVYNGNHNMPRTYAYPTSTPSYLLAGSGTVPGEYAHYVDVRWDGVAPGVNTPNYSSTAFYSLSDQSYEKKMRQQLSLNTCQGCHNGETKTIFTQVRPLAYSATAKYWDPTPDYDTGFIDTRFASNTDRFSTHNNYPEPVSKRYVVKVSAFLTGRNFSGTIASGGAFDDDSTSVAEDATDNTMEGLFYVNDPANKSFFRVTPENKKWGYNDLERRKIDLCKLLSSSCTFSVLDVVTKVVLKPLPYGSH